MAEPHTQQAHPAHTRTVVPLLYVGRPSALAASGALSDIAPTLLAMKGLSQPAEMNGKSLIAWA
jgi:2,3-bisphosphoglycerate-independent phosphoglycerate mutase